MLSNVRQSRSWGILRRPLMAVVNPLIGQFTGQWQWLRSPFGWQRKFHPWSALILISLGWIRQRDRRPQYQMRLHRTLLKLNFRDIELFMADFVRPEFWLM
jgi:hypothetical protein